MECLFVFRVSGLKKNVFSKCDSTKDVSYLVMTCHMALTRIGLLKPSACLIFYSLFAGDVKIVKIRQYIYCMI